MATIYNYWDTLDGYRGPLDHGAIRFGIKEEDYKRNALPGYHERVVNLILAQGWKLVSVSWVGGCKITTGRHVYHFTKEVEI